MIEEQFGRLKGADWFKFAYKKDVLVLGIGGIGSNLSYCLARIGCILHLYDLDNVELINLAGQMYKQSDIGKNKAVALKETITMFSPSTIVNTYGKYDENSITGDIVFCGFDNMGARELAFMKWMKYINEEAENKEECLFMDGRMTANMIQIYTIPGNRDDLIAKYKEEALFKDDTVQELDCTFKQTSHVALIIGGFMTSFFTNWLANTYTDIKCNQVPYFFQYFTSLNLFTNENI